MLKSPPVTIIVTFHCSYQRFKASGTSAQDDVLHGKAQLALYAFLKQHTLVVLTEISTAQVVF